MLRHCAAVALVVSACGGSNWMKEPLTDERDPMLIEGAQSPSGAPTGVQNKTIGGRAPAGRVIGKFRNTYYDFPREQDYSGDGVDVMNAQCQSIAKVPRGFHDAVCVQGSGSLKRGGTISFAKRDCDCAQLCPRTQQKICFDALDPQAFPWGRGAAGKPIAPLRSVAADTGVLPLGTVIYLPELDGAGEPASDGCFVVEDRGVRVQGEHVDIFTGHPGQTAILNQQVPSNQGVTVVVDVPKCARLAGR